MTQTEALKLALEALETAWYHVGTFCPTDEAIELYDDARAAIKEALARPEQKMTYQQAAQLINEMKSQPEQEPVAWMDKSGITHKQKLQRDWIPLYTTPPQRTWVGLTDEEREDIATEYGLEWLAYRSAFKEVEAKLRSKNNG